MDKNSLETIITKNINLMVKSSPKSKIQIAKEVGIHHTSLSHLLSGKSFPSVYTLVKLCHALDCTYEDILGKL